MFEQLLQIAKENLTTLNETVDGLPAPQVTVLLTANDTIYVAINDVDGTICETLVKNQDTKVVCMLTMWKDCGLDLSSYRFRTALVNMDERNKVLWLQSTETHIPHSLPSPPFKPLTISIPV